MKMRALKSMRYQTRRLKAGDEFEPSAKWARIYRGTRQAVAVDEPLPAPKPDGPTRSEIRRMKKDELAGFIRDRGHDADEDEETWQELVEKALALAE